MDGCSGLVPKPPFSDIWLLPHHHLAGVRRRAPPSGVSANCSIQWLLPTAHPMVFPVASEGLSLLPKPPFLALQRRFFLPLLHPLSLRVHRLLSLLSHGSDCQSFLPSPPFNLVSTLPGKCFRFWFPPPSSSWLSNLYQNFNLSHVQISSFQLPVRAF